MNDYICVSLFNCKSDGTWKNHGIKKSKLYNITKTTMTGYNKNRSLSKIK